MPVKTQPEEQRVHKLMKLAEVADVLQVSYSYVRDLVDHGHLPAVEIPKGKPRKGAAPEREYRLRRVQPDDLRAFLAANSTVATDEQREELSARLRRELRK